MPIPLTMLLTGSYGRIVSLPPGAFRSQAIRFGLSEGSRVMVRERVPRGPVVIRRGLQEVAIGRNLAGSIAVEPE